MGRGVGTRRPSFEDQVVFDRALTAPVDRGLLGWDNRPGVNRYDLHPIVRGVVWGNLDSQNQATLYSTLRDHFDAIPMVSDSRRVKSLEELTPAIELYNSLVGLKR